MIAQGGSSHPTGTVPVVVPAAESTNAGLPRGARALSRRSGQADCLTGRPSLYSERR